MRIEYSNPGKVLITMFDYIDGMLATLPTDMSGVAASPAANHLFEVNPTVTALDKTKAELFHHYTAKLHFLCKRAQPDIQTVVAFLMTRVKGPDDDDDAYKKLRRVMRYLRATKDMPLTLEADHTHILKWWDYASFTIHPDMKGHTGGLLSLGKGMVYGTWRGHKMVTQSSTEAELVEPLRRPPTYPMDPQLPGCAGVRRQGLGCPSRQQEHDPARGERLHVKQQADRVLLRHRRVKAKELSIKYCPTEDMLSDYFTKQLPGDALPQTARPHHER
jgi:hypothetical protein